MRTRTSVLTLVVVAPRPEIVERAMAAVKALATRHPSRAVILSPTDLDGPASFDAHVYASCQVPEHGTAEICTEEILIKVGGELAQHLSSTIAPLLIHDLPVVLWWPDDVPFGRPTSWTSPRNATASSWTPGTSGDGLSACRAWPTRSMAASWSTMSAGCA